MFPKGSGQSWRAANLYVTLKVDITNNMRDLETIVARP